MQFTHIAEIFALTDFPKSNSTSRIEVLVINQTLQTTQNMAQPYAALSTGIESSITHSVLTLGFGVVRIFPEPLRVLLSLLGVSVIIGDALLTDHPSPMLTTSARFFGFAYTPGDSSIDGIIPNSFPQTVPVFCDLVNGVSDTAHFGVNMTIQ